MKTFWDLPKPVREKIYRLDLVADEQPVDFEAYKRTCGYTEICGDEYEHIGPEFKPAKIKLPQLLQVSGKLERESSPIYFGENSFGIHGPEGLRIWRRFTGPRHIKQIRKVVLLHWLRLEGVGSGTAFKALGALPNLASLVVVFDEEEELRKLLYGGEYRPTYRLLAWDKSLGFGPQVNLQLLRLNGITGLRSLRGLRDVKFLKTIEAHDDPYHPSMPEGFFKTTIMREIMQPKKPVLQAAGSFRFLDLPPELRNIIYSMNLSFPGPTYPVSGKPLSVTSRLKYRRHSDRDTLPVPRSALDVLRVNKQVYGEVYKLFYQNDLVFSDTMEIQDFMSSLGDERLDCLRNLTIFYDTSVVDIGKDNQLTGPGMGATLLLLRRLNGLRKLHLLLQFRTINPDKGLPLLSKRFIDQVDVSRLKDAKTLLTLRGVTDLKIHDLDLSHQEIYQRRFTAHGNNQNEVRADHIRECIAHQKAALRHFNHGLHLAQTGLVVHELYTEKNWRDKDSWPALQGSDCGLHKGCSCGVRHVETETDGSETSH